MAALTGDSSRAEFLAALDRNGQRLDTMDVDSDSAERELRELREELEDIRELLDFADAAKARAEAEGLMQA